MSKLKVDMEITRSQYCFLRDRYNKDDRASAKLLVKIAVMEVVATQAKKELKINSWEKEAYDVIKRLVSLEDEFECKSVVHELSQLLKSAPKELTNE